MKIRPSGSTEGLLDIQQAATFLRVSQTSLRRWTNAGTLPCLRVGGRRERRFRRSDLLAFMENHGTQDSADSDARESRPALACLHASAEERTSQAAVLLANALAERRRCFLLAPPSIREEILSALTVLRVEAPADRAHGWLIQEDAISTAQDPQTYWQAQLGRAERDGVTALCIVSSVAAQLSWEEVTGYERRFHASVSAGLPVQTLCLYDVRSMSGAEVLDTLQAHPETLSPLARELSRRTSASLVTVNRR